jgi:hypothetical protein
MSFFEVIRSQTNLASSEDMEDMENEDADIPYRPICIDVDPHTTDSLESHISSKTHSEDLQPGLYSTLVIFWG